MSEKLLLKYMCAGADERISENTTYEQWHGLFNMGVIYYTIPPKRLAHFLTDVGPVADPDTLPTQGKADFHQFASGDWRIFIAYAPETDTVYWKASH
jgi:hypothetical protein